MIRILIVDDSAFMRKLLSDLFTGEKDFVVVDTARNGKEAVEKTKLLQPDLVTLDVEMPIMDGLEALRLIMQELLKGTSRFALGENAAPVHAVYPAGGFDSLPIKLVMETCCGACS